MQESPLCAWNLRRGCGGVPGPLNFFADDFIKAPAFRVKNSGCGCALKASKPQLCRS